jgi:hypothetical protein
MVFALAAGCGDTPRGTMNAHFALPVAPGTRPAVKRTLLALCLLLLAAAPAAATTYYVSPSGNDSNAGSQAAPWKSLAKANNTLAAGDVCLIAAGTYGDPIQPAANGTAGGRIRYVGSLANPASVTVANIYIDKAYISVLGVKSAGTLELFYTNESAKAVHDSVAYSITMSGPDFVGAKYSSVSRCTITGRPSFMGDHSSAGEAGWISNCDSDTLRYNVITTGVIPIHARGLIMRCYTQHCVVDSNRITGTFELAQTGDCAGRYLYNSTYNTFRDNSWRFEADAPLPDNQYVAYALRDSSAHNLFERDTMLCGLQSGVDIGGRLCNAGSAPGQNLCVGNHWKDCVFRTTGFTANMELLNGAIIEGTVFASAHAFPLWMLGGVQNSIIRNCTFIGMTAPAIKVEGDIRLGGNQFYSNIFYTDSVAACFSGRPVLFHGWATGFTEDNNLFYSRAAAPGVTASGQSIYWASSACSAPGPGTPWATATGNDTHSVYGAPLFADTRWASLNPHLLAGSAAIGLAQGGGDAGAYPFVSGGGDVTAPAAITNLAVVQVSNDYALLAWTAPGDDGSTGTAAGYDLRYSTQPITAGNFASATQVATPPPILAAGSAQSYAMTGLTGSTTYYFALKTRDEAGNWSAISNLPTAATTATDQVPPARISDFR